MNNRDNYVFIVCSTSKVQKSVLLSHFVMADKAAVTLALDVIAGRGLASKDRNGA